MKKSLIFILSEIPLYIFLTVLYLLKAIVNIYATIKNKHKPILSGVLFYIFLTVLYIFAAVITIYVIHSGNGDVLFSSLPEIHTAVCLGSVGIVAMLAFLVDKKVYGLSLSTFILRTQPFERFNYGIIIPIMSILVPVNWVLLGSGNFILNAVGLVNFYICCFTTTILTYQALKVLWDADNLDEKAKSYAVLQYGKNDTDGFLPLFAEIDNNITNRDLKSLLDNVRISLDEKFIEYMINCDKTLITAYTTNLWIIRRNLDNISNQSIKLEVFNFIMNIFNSIRITDDKKSNNYECFLIMYAKIMSETANIIKDDIVMQSKAAYLSEIYQIETIKIINDGIEGWEFIISLIDDVTTSYCSQELKNSIFNTAVDIKDSIAVEIKNIIYTDERESLIRDFILSNAEQSNNNPDSYFTEDPEIPEPDENLINEISQLFHDYLLPENYYEVNEENDYEPATTDSESDTQKELCTV
jgi:hypothetical protein